MAKKTIKKDETSKSDSKFIKVASDDKDGLVIAGERVHRGEIILSYYVYVDGTGYHYYKLIK